MKTAYPLLDVSRRKPKKPKKPKLLIAPNIEQRYRELLRLRAMVNEVEAANRNPR